jgi:hypothetical protein
LPTLYTLGDESPVAFGNYTVPARSGTQPSGTPRSSLSPTAAVADHMFGLRAIPLSLLTIPDGPGIKWTR